MASKKGARKKEKVIAVADCETDPFDGVTIVQPFIWGYYDGKNYEEFRTTEAFMKFIYTLPETILYAHNGGKFDWMFILDYIDDFEKVMIINGRLSKFKIGDVEFRDSMNILPVSLKKMQKDEFDYNKMKVEVREQFMDEIKMYLYHDCKYLHDYVSKFIEQYGLHLTQAAAAMKIWQDMTNVTAPNDGGGKIYEQFKQFYYGGRCEAFYSGTFDYEVAVYDINSAYPFAMLSEHPISLSYAERNNRKCKGQDESISGDCFVILSCISRGCFPFRANDGSLIFPDDNEVRRYFVSGWEYIVAWETNAISSVKHESVFQFDELIDFKEYIEYFYKQRQEAKALNDNANDLFAKILMNSLYGKFGSNPDNYNSFMIVDGGIFTDEGLCENPVETARGNDMPLKNRGSWQFAGQIGSRFLAQQPIVEESKRWYNVGTAASITGYVRAMVWRAKNSSHNVLYCDTDSMVVQKVAKDLPIGNNLGQWKHEGDFKRGAIAGKKMYALEYSDAYYKKLMQKAKAGESVPKTKVATKGARLDYDQVEAVSLGQIIEYKPQAPTFSVHHEPRFTSRKIKKTEKKLA